MTFTKQITCLYCHAFPDGRWGSPGAVWQSITAQDFLSARSCWSDLYWTLQQHYSSISLRHDELFEKIHLECPGFSLPLLSQLLLQQVDSSCCSSDVLGCLAAAMEKWCSWTASQTAVWNLKNGPQPPDTHREFLCGGVGGGPQTGQVVLKRRLIMLAVPKGRRNMWSLQKHCSSLYLYLLIEPQWFGPFNMLTFVDLMFDHNNKKFSVQILF